MSFPLTSSLETGGEAVASWTRSEKWKAKQLQFNFQIAFSFFSVSHTASVVRHSGDCPDVLCDVDVRALEPAGDALDGEEGAPVLPGAGLLAGAEVGGGNGAEVTPAEGEALVHAAWKKRNVGALNCSPLIYGTIKRGSFVRETSYWHPPLGHKFHHPLLLLLYSRSCGTTWLSVLFFLNLSRPIVRIRK